MTSVGSTVKLTVIVPLFPAASSTSTITSYTQAVVKSDGRVHPDWIIVWSVRIAHVSLYKTQLPVSQLSTISCEIGSHL